MILPVYDANKKQFYKEMNGDPNVRERMDPAEFFALARAVHKAQEAFIRTEMYQHGGALKAQADADYMEAALMAR